MKIIGLIPSRMSSVRLPGKALLDICGIPMVVHTYKRAILSTTLEEVYVCTDSNEIAKVCEQYNVPYIMTSQKHKNGTERIAEAAMNFKNADYFVDIQGDEPLINPRHIDSVVNFHMASQYDLILPHVVISEVNNENIVKVISSEDRVLYLTRADCPYPFRQSLMLKKHLSIISFTKNSLQRYSKLQESFLEKVEGIELLRAIENGLSIGTCELVGESFSVDVEVDYKNAIIAMKGDDLFQQYRM